jgi:F-type H+-transporting ATPase subunit b
MLELDKYVMLIEAGIFFVTLILLNQWLFKPLLSFMEKRDAKLKEEMNTVSSNTNEAQKYEEEIASILERAKAEAGRIKKEASDAAKKEANVMVGNELAKIETEKNVFNEELLSKKKELNSSLEASSEELKSMLLSKLKEIA